MSHPAAMETAGFPVRKSQADRRNETHERLLDAAVRCLETLGYARTTTTEVCRLAGVSQGALFKHFATKAVLMSAAAGHLFSSLVLDYQRRFARLPAGSTRLPAAIDLLWALFETPRMHAAFELYVAARTEPELARSLRPVADAHYRNLHQLARELFPTVGPAHAARFDALVDLIIGAFQGASLGNLVARTEQRSALVTIACELAASVIEAETR